MRITALVGRNRVQPGQGMSTVGLIVSVIASRYRRSPIFFYKEMPRSLICPGSTGHWWPGQLLRHDWADYTFSSKMFIRFRKCVHSYFQSTLLASFELFQSSNCLHFENLSNPKYDYLGRRRCTIYITKKLFMQMQNSMLIVLFNLMHPEHRNFGVGM